MGFPIVVHVHEGPHRWFYPSKSDLWLLIGNEIQFSKGQLECLFFDFSPISLSHQFNTMPCAIPDNTAAIHEFVEKLTFDDEPCKIPDDTAAFNELVEKMAFYNEIVYTNQPFLQAHPTRVQEIHDELSKTVGSGALPAAGEAQKENLKNVEAMCVKEPESVTSDS